MGVILALTDGERVAFIGLLTATIVAVVPGVGWVLRQVIVRNAAAITIKNTEEHQINKQVLERIEGAVLDVSQKFSDHLSWHLNPPTSNSTTTVVVGTVGDIPKEQAA